MLNIEKIFTCLFGLAFAVAMVVVSISVVKEYQLYLHHSTVEGEIISPPREHCIVKFSYSVGGKKYDSSESGECKSKIGDKRTVYFDTTDPSSSSINKPAFSFEELLFAIIFISFTFIVFIVSNIISRKKKVGKISLDDKR